MLSCLFYGVPPVWNNQASSIEIKKRITWTVIREIVVRVEDNRLHGMIHWHGGDHTVLDVATRVRGRWRDAKEANTEAETAALITASVRMMPDFPVSRPFSTDWANERSAD